MKYERIKLEYDEGVVFLTLNDPEALNAVSLQMIRELNQAVDEIQEPPAEVRCLLITGAGRGFCVGANLNDPELRELVNKKGSEKEDVLKKWYNPFFLKLRGLNVPIVTAVNGPTAGVGMSMALMGDMVLAARSAFFLQAFRNIGLIPDGGSTYILPRLIGWTRALEMSLMGERVTAERALEWAMINRVYDDDRLMTEACTMARNLAKGPTMALGLIRRAYWQSADSTFEEQLNLESEYQKIAAQTADYKEGLSAFQQKRPPEFEGR
jgi:2-(1,2-epoxy-1,2-dihydrophenyl)acetyl-CoA isomerase